MDPTQATHAAPKKKNNRKKKNAGKAPKELAPTGGRDTDDTRDDATEDDEPETPTTSVSSAKGALGDSEEINDESNGHLEEERKEGPTVLTSQPDGEAAEAPDTATKLEAMSKEREALRAEAERLRKQLESIQESHDLEVSHLKADLEESNAAKEHAEEQYQTLLGRVEKIKETLSDRLKRDKAELEEAKERIEELEAQNEELRGSAESSGQDVDKLKDELQDATRELATLRSRSNLSTENWSREREDLVRTIAHYKEEMETTSHAMGEWEVIAMEERSIRENLSEKIRDLEEQVFNLRESYEATAADRDSQATLVDNLQNALQEIQEARKRELRDMVETSEAQLQEHKKLVQEAVARAAEAQGVKAELEKELERTAPFEKEVKEKSLLIGKLRHEAIILNEHLTKALRYLKKTKPEDNVDRQVVTNHLLHFLTLDRGDAKRFQVLQVMAGYLNWTDEQREQAGLARPGASNSLRLPLSPFHRTPSSPALNTDIFSEPTPTSATKDKESLADLWAEFLERSASEGAGGAPSRKDSMSSITTGTGSGRPDSRA
ncbi:GRIP domain-containing protein [Escovopsis weberi]|uniref:GRIP domain-containing protein n=1 Tax=Escovopsis weberi TaxID=150374 RepID=A0A0M8N2T3_ESCWE|nr:GRIP domain-containing protein [Escovopsis weberi]